jgi:hypothetical protein
MKPIFEFNDGQIKIARQLLVTSASPGSFPLQ